MFIDFLVMLLRRLGPRLERVILKRICLSLTGVNIIRLGIWDTERVKCNDYN